MTGPLSWLRVVDLTDIRGALCGRLLADLGADVVRVLAPGDRPDDVDHLYRNANKAGVAADIATDTGREALHHLCEHADVLLDNLGPVRRRPGLELHEIRDRHPHLVHVALTDLGLDGPRSHWHLEPLPAFAASGALHASGFPDRAPCWLPGYLAHDTASVHGAIAAIAGVMDRRRRGEGQTAEISVQEAALGSTTPWSVVIEDYLHINPYLPAAGTRNAEGAYWVLPAADGWVRTVIGSQRHWDGFVSLMGTPDALSGPEWSQPGFRLMNADVVRLVAAERLVDRTREQLFEQALAVGTPLGVVHRPEEFVTHAQTVHRGLFATTGFPGLGDAPFAQGPWKLSATPASLRRPAPVAESAVEAAAAFAPRSVPQVAPRDSGELLLDGVRVVEFGMAAVVPEMCWILSELGADVVKIESIAHPDVLRQASGDRVNCAFTYNAESRGRRSVALDLGTEEGRAIALELCARADIVAENYRGGVLAGLGLDHADIAAVNPGVVYVSSQGYGRGGPLGKMQAFGPLNSAFSGTHYLWNHPDTPYACGTSLNHPDHIAGKLLAVAVLAALDHRDATGEGQLVDMAQTDAAAYLTGEVYAGSAVTGRPAEAFGNRSERFAPHDVYPTAGEDRWLALAVTTDEQWRALCGVIGWTDAPQDLAAAAGRLAARDAIDDRVAAWTATVDGETAAGLLQDAGISAMPVQGPVDHRADVHLAARDFLVHLVHPEVGPETHVGNPMRFSALPQRTALSAPQLGVHTAEVLGEMLGFSRERVEDLVDRGVCR
ncbi:MAG: CoA transferase [Acidimicrobiales bacterium]|nr:CoA transferase [Acidimicrobiales bacterium]